MDLVYSHQLMVAVDQQGGRSLPVTGSRACRQVEHMADAGLVEMSRQGARDPDVSIDRLTDLGQTFLRTFAAPPPVPPPGAPEERTPVGLAHGFQFGRGR